MTPIRIDEISIEKALIAPFCAVLRIRCGDYTYTGQFDHHLGHFALTVSEALKYFGKAHGVITEEKDGTVKAKR